MGLSTHNPTTQFIPYKKGKNKQTNKQTKTKQTKATIFFMRDSSKLSKQSNENFANFSVPHYMTL
jgi:hypothetical protein